VQLRAAACCAHDGQLAVGARQAQEPSHLASLLTPRERHDERVQRRLCVRLDENLALELGENGRHSAQRFRRLRHRKLSQVVLVLLHRRGAER